MKILILLLLANMVFAQKWWIPTKEELISYGVTASSGVSYGINQAIAHKNFGQGNSFIDYNVSWKNKYRDFDGGDLRERFFGSKTFLVWTTDLYHLSSTTEKITLGVGATVNAFDLFRGKDILPQYRKKDRWKVILLKKIIYPSIIRGLAFELTYRNL